jgi:predicted transposase YbfD/YdcC
MDIIVIAVCAVICNADTWKDMRIWAESHRKWLKKMLLLPSGVPSSDTLRRTISRIDPEAFQEAFLKWLSGMKQVKGEVIAIDGKTLRGTNFVDQSPLHIVSAWATKSHLTLGQRQVDGKSNEITAIPKLLKRLQLKGAIVTIDAMGCQKAIAQMILDGKGDYCLAVKDNQESLAKEVFEEFQKAFEQRPPKELKIVEPKRKHGRYEERRYLTMPVPPTLKALGLWPGLKSIGLTVTYRAPNEQDLGDGDVRYYIMSFESDVHRFADAVRSHWGIENSLHWVMDLTFHEDDSRIRKEHGGENVSWLRRLAITLLKHEGTLKDSIRAKRIRAAYDVEYLEAVLNAVPPAN